MSERFTSIRLRKYSTVAWAERGEKTPDEMVAILRAKAVTLKEEAEAVLAAADEDFHIATYLGMYVQRKYTVLQEGKHEND